MIEPTVWETYDSVEIRELGNEDIDILVQFVISCQLDELLLHPRMKGEMFETYTDFYKFALGKKESLIAVDRETYEVVGVIICLIMTEKMKSWINLRLLAKGPQIKTIFNLFYLMMCDAKELRPPDEPMDSVQVLRIAVPRLHKGHNWKPRLLNAVTKMAACLKMPCIIHLAFTINDQIRAERAGMKEQCRVYYLQYIDPETRKRPFILTKQDELCVILYRKDIENVIPYYEIKGVCIYPKRMKSSRRYYKLPSIGSSELSPSSSSSIRFINNRSYRLRKKKKEKKQKVRLHKLRVEYSNSIS